MTAGEWTRSQGLRSRMDEGLAALDSGEEVDGEKFRQGILDELDSQQAKHKAG